MTTPRGLPEWAEGQALPATTGNQISRMVEPGACHFPITDRLTTPPGSCSDGAAYIITATATGAWTGKENQIAIAVGTNAASGWYYRTAIEGFTAYVQDENLFYDFSGSAWASRAAIAAEASASEIWAATETAKYVSPDKLGDAAVPAVLTSGATITPDGANGVNFTLTIAHNATLANPSNFRVGQSGVIEITQDGTGSRTLAYGTNWKFPGGAPVLSTAVGTVDALAYFVVASGRILCTLTKAFSS